MCIRDSDRLANRLLMYALGLGNFFNRLAKNNMCVNSAALDLRQRIESVPPVSYTHLDVYKRQVLG